MRNYTLLYIYVAVAMCCGHVWAQSPSFRTKESSLLVGIGRTSQYDTYLSPQEYHGTQLTWYKESVRPTHWHDGRITFQSLFTGDMQRSQTPADNARYLGGHLHYDAGWHYHWHDILTPHLSLRAGAQTGGTLGFLYTTRGGNNPANARARIRLSASVGAQYHLHIRRLPLRLDYQADLPVAGLAFSPNYGQSYYEMWQKGGYEHNVGFTHFGNALSLRQCLSVTLRFRRLSLRLAYLSDLQQQRLNGLRQHQYTRSFLIGWSKDLYLAR